VNLPDALFLTALSVLVVALAGFSVVVAVSAARRSAATTRVFGVAGVVRALELRPGDPASTTRWSFYLHRLTGIGVLGFLALHIVDVSLFAISHRLYNHVHALYGTPALRVLECGLVFAVLFHTLNGLRIVAVDGWSLSTRTARRSLVPVVVVSLVAGAVASGFILAPVL
jgi:succinate dehydrogenase / fumarate reductase cytochrome b subunit